ncbi:formylglycine-generating enzyme family protein [Cyclobacterium xiamenense]|jgi:formylglycine-generating enzyme required for sulfatase activity|uniref:formylglycine-generating enzyme family protein n=1 Tax=Cyclobacterium xiamenense TaxID=1297121 RepID=UPI0012B8EBCD|nr:formylglycine-generating enzyme family protein [Cyclobacterium xiamenense]
MVDRVRRITFLGAIVAVLVIGSAYQVEEAFEPYTQEIPGTGKSFSLVPIPEGSFRMGSNAGDPDESPVHEVKIDPFWMASHEVTWDLFELFLDKGFEASTSEGPLTPEVDGLTRPSIPYLDMTFGMGKENKPAIAMTQYGAIQFCRWLYLKTGVFFRLPTEAEWEYAARAGTETDYFFGDDPAALGTYAWYAGNSEGVTHTVGQKEPNPWGLYDILGNVNEWTQDHYQADAYDARQKPADNPLIESEELYPKVIRGGSYDSEASQLKSSKRFASTPEWKRIDPQIPKSQWWFPEAPFLGMRVVRPLNPPSPEEIAEYFGKLPEEDY